MFDERFWLAIAFFGFVILIIKHVAPIITKQLDAKSKEIAEELLAAKEMKEKAEKVLAIAQERHTESLAFSEQIIKDASVEAQKYFDEALKLAESEIAKKMTAVENRIKQEQESAIREMKIKIIGSAMHSVENNLQNVQKNQSDTLVNKAIDDISKLVN